jgi:3-oxoacyl-[acyl-carrier protein] reductase
MMRLKDRIALVTGAGSGIGRAIALRLAEEGARVVVNDVTRDAAQKTVTELGANASRGRAIEADVSDSGQVRRMFADIEREWGGLDVLVNNAGIATTTGEERSLTVGKLDARVSEMMSGQPIQTHWDVTQNLSDEAWHQMIGVHLNGTFFCTREASSS